MSDQRKRYPCPYMGCKVSCARRNALKRHILLHTNTENYVCDKCGKGFIRSDSLKLHKTIHSESRPFKCNFKGCDKAFKKKTSLSDHQAVHSNTRFKCKKCKNVFRYKKNLFAHQRSIHNEAPNGLEKRNHCPYCPVAFGSPSKLKKHLLSHTGERPFECTVEGCKRRYMCKSHLNSHLRVHALNKNMMKPGTYGELEYRKCDICQRIFKNEKFLEEHILMHKSNSKDAKSINKTPGEKTKQKMKTKDIKKATTSNRHRKRRLRRRTKSNRNNNSTIPSSSTSLVTHPVSTSPSKENEFGCKLCNHISKTKNDVIIHQRYHAIHTLCEEMQISNNDSSTSLILYECKICLKIMKSESCSIKHLFTTHSVEQFYDCNVCNRIFMQENDLNEHLKDHFDSDNNKIQTCGNESATANLIKINIRQNTNLNKEHIKKQLTKRIVISIKRNRQIDKLSLQYKNVIGSNPVIELSDFNMKQHNEHEQTEEYSLSETETIDSNVPLSIIRNEIIKNNQEKNNCKKLLIKINRLNDEPSERNSNIPVDLNDDSNNLINETINGNQNQDYSENLLESKSTTNTKNIATNEIMDIESVSESITDKNDETQNIKTNKSKNFDNQSDDLEILAIREKLRRSLLETVEDHLNTCKEEEGVEVTNEALRSSEILDEYDEANNHLNVLKEDQEIKSGSIDSPNICNVNVKNDDDLSTDEDQIINNEPIHNPSVLNDNIKIDNELKVLEEHQEINNESINSPSVLIDNIKNDDHVNIIENDQSLRNKSPCKNFENVTKINCQTFLNENCAKSQDLNAIDVLENHEEFIESRENEELSYPGEQQTHKIDCYNPSVQLPPSNMKISSVVIDEESSSSTISIASSLHNPILQSNEIPTIDLIDEDSNDIEIVDVSLPKDDKKDIKQKYNNKLSSSFSFLNINWNELEDKEKLLSVIKKNLSDLCCKLDNLNIPIPFEDIVFLSTNDYVREMSNYDFSVHQLNVIRAIRAKTRAPLNRKKKEIEKQIINKIRSSVSFKPSPSLVSSTLKRQLESNEQLQSKLQRTLCQPSVQQQQPLPPLQPRKIVFNPASLYASNQQSNNISGIATSVIRPTPNVATASSSNKFSNNNSTTSLHPNSFPVMISFMHPQDGYEIRKEIPIQINHTSTTSPQTVQNNFNELSTSSLELRTINSNCMTSTTRNMCPITNTTVSRDFLLKQQEIYHKPETTIFSNYDANQLNLNLKPTTISLPSRTPTVIVPPQSMVTANTPMNTVQTSSIKSNEPPRSELFSVFNTNSNSYNIGRSESDNGLNNSSRSNMMISENSQDSPDLQNKIMTVVMKSNSTIDNSQAQVYVVNGNLEINIGSPKHL